jgi:glycosyltransferase involved in cell wall biosynthesis
LKLETRNYKFEACETGILCEPDNVEALAEAMKKIIMDDEYRESVRAKAIERSKYYSIENTMDRWEELLASVQRRRS